MLGEPLNSLIQRLYEAQADGKPLPWEEIDLAATTFFDDHPVDSAAHDAYFGRFTMLWRNFFNSGKPARAEEIWERALQPALAWEHAHPGQYLHKGTPYYFWAMSVILYRDMDRGYLLAHRALEEDIRTNRTPQPNTPAYALVALDYEKPDQAFRLWVIAQADYLKHLLEHYNATHGRNLTMDDVKTRFLASPPTLHVLFLFTYSLGRLINIVGEPKDLRTNPFAGQLELNLCFDIVLVIDALIKTKCQSNSQFIDLAEHLLRVAERPLSKHHLGKINGQFKDDFSDTLPDALDGNLTVPGVALDRLQCDVSLAYGLRNYGAHKVGTSAILYDRFEDVERTLFRVFFAALDHLYR